ncbi:unnamed protein product [Rangifer tarandus platyrhynchus]|uniref:Uncharacterized protein n=2 Tax=Rangifer tarandus platyrhynchus TaxID=3082113 RepID=A0ACB0DWU6_RANTA|nr:unnamed protein product [Rangifer tarandus platyrhynchus]CAI9692805.1 unnamed protein product [Rangifer tarandus platyrhynchus]
MRSQRRPRDTLASSLSMAGVEKGTAKNNREREPEEGPGGSPRAFTNMDFLELKEVLCFKNSWCFSRRSEVACSGQLNCSRRFVCPPIPRGPFVRRCGCLICHLPLLIGPRPLDSYFPWKMDVDSALWAENAAPAGPLAESSQRTWMLRGEPGNGEAALQGLDASAECRFSLCYCTPCQADFFLSEKFKAKTRI